MSLPYSESVYHLVNLTLISPPLTHKICMYLQVPLLLYRSFFAIIFWNNILSCAHRKLIVYSVVCRSPIITDTVYLKVCIGYVWRAKI